MDDLPRAKAKRLENYVLEKLADPDRYAWTKRLRAFLDESRERIRGWTEEDSFRPDRFIGVPKAKPGSGNKYRVLAPYALRDAIVDSVFASYLRDLIDCRLDENCYAFRLPKGAAPITHHDAVADLRRFANDRTMKALWVAECDIQGFFDSVSHERTRQELSAMLAEIDVPVDPRLLHFVNSFMKGYDYRDARRHALSQLERMKVLRARIYNPDEALKTCRLPIRSTSRIGIPQGSSFSSVLANVVLTRADRAVRATTRSHQDTFYARYVDDIVVVSTNRHVATRSMNAYRRALRNLELPDHSPQQIGAKGAASSQHYWEAKSKAPYSWTLRGFAGIQWVGFLGYQMKRDGTLRVRRSSIAKELAKQRKAVDDIIRLIDKTRGRAQQEGRILQIPRLHRIHYAAMMHLISIGVGYPSEPLIWPASNSVCWASGFRLLREGPRDLSLLRVLDRGRGIALKALRRRLRSLASLPGLEERKAQQPIAKFVIKRDGRPLSYYAQFAENLGAHSQPRDRGDQIAAAN